MSDAKETNKKSPIELFREALHSTKAMEATVLEGLKSTNAKVRSLAIKMAFRTQEHAFIKKNVLGLAKDKSKKVLRTLSNKITRDDLRKKVKSLLVPKNKRVVTKPQAEEAVAAPPAEAKQA
jgi:hypothetical protein